MLNENIFNKDLALFVGAGASIAEPCGLPSFYEMRDFIIETLCQNIPQIKVEYVDRIQTKPEILLQILWEYFGNGINPLKGFEYAQININHRIISNICKKGIRFIITTNFDRCIEKALDEQNIKYEIFYKSPSNEAETNKLMQLINDEQRLVIWKPHGDCLHTETLCYTVKQVARLKVSKYLKLAYDFILQKFNLLTLGYSGYDDDLFPILLDFSKKMRKKNKIYWNSYYKVTPNTPPDYLQKYWGKNFHLCVGDMQSILSIFKDDKIRNRINRAENEENFWKKGVKSEFLKISFDWTIAVLGQYYNRVQLYNHASYLWKKGLECKACSDVNQLRFKLNLLGIEEIDQVQEIYRQSLRLGEYKISEISLLRIIKGLIRLEDYKNVRIYLKIYKKNINKYSEYFIYSWYVKCVHDYLSLKYKENRKRINSFLRNIIFRAYEKSKSEGDIIMEIEMLKSYIASLAIDNKRKEFMFEKILEYVPILEAYNIPINLEDLYFSISMYASKCRYNKIGLKYINKCLEKLESCYENKMYDENEYFELKALTLHQKSMLATAKEAITLCKESIKLVESINLFVKKTDRDFFLGTYNSSIAANYLIIKEYVKAKKYAEIALAHQVSIHDIRGEARTLIDYAEILLIEGKKEESIQSFRKAYEIFFSVGESTLRIENTLQRLHLNIIKY